MKGKKKVFAKLLSCVLVLSMVFGSTTTALAAQKNASLTVTYKDSIDDKVIGSEIVIASNKKNNNYYGIATASGINTNKADSNGYSYKFDGWSTSKSGGSVQKSISNIRIDKDTTIYARYTKSEIKIQQYTVKFKNGTFTTLSEQKIIQGEFAKAPTVADTAIGNKSDKLSIDVFVGWTIQGDTSGKVYTNEEINKKTVTANVTYNAKFESKKIAFFFVRTDGKEPKENGSTSYDKSLYTPLEGSEQMVYRVVSKQEKIFGDIADKATEDKIAAVVQGNLPKVSDFPGLTKKGYNDNTHYIRWYVLKQANNGWHIDGVLRSEPTIKFVDWDNRVIQDTTPLKHDTNIIAPADPSREKDNTDKVTYRFLGWKVDGSTRDIDFEEGRAYTKEELAQKVIEKDIVFKAVYEETNYVTVSFEDSEGKQIGKTEKIVKNTSATVIPADQKGYDNEKVQVVFDGWTIKGDKNSPVYTAENLKTLPIERDTVFVPKFTETKKFLVRFMTEEIGTVVGEAQQFVLDGANAICADVNFKAETEVAVYEFLGWIDSITGQTLNKDAVNAKTIKADTDFTANFKVTNKYLVTFKDDNTVVSSERVLDGKTVKSVPASSRENTKYADYDFVGWKSGNKVYSADEIKKLPIEGDMTFEAQYNVTNYVYVNFVGEDNKALIEEQKVVVGTSKYNTPEAPAKAEDENNTYSFAGWTVDGKVVTPGVVNEDTTFKASYNATKKLEVKFFDDDATTQLGTTAKVVAGRDKVTTPADPTKATANGVEYTFAGWRMSGQMAVLTNEQVEAMTFTADTNFVAVYAESYLVTFMNEDKKVESRYIPSGQRVSSVPTVSKENDDRHDYEFKAWVSNNTQYSEAAVKDFVVTAPTVFEAEYKVTEFVFVDFVDEKDNTIIGKQRVEVGTEGYKVPTAPTKDEDTDNTYSFAGWTVNGEVVTPGVVNKDTTFKASYSSTAKLNINFYNLGRQIGDTQKVVANRDSVTVPSDPSRNNEDLTHYEFIGWQINGKGEVLKAADISNMTFTEDTDFHAAYKEFYAVGFVNNNESVGELEFVEAGKTVSSVPTVSKEDTDYVKYDFAGWKMSDNETVYSANEVGTMSINKPTLFFAEYTETEKYMVQFFDFSGNLIEGFTQYIVKEAVASAPDDLSITETNEAKYEFLGWKENNTGNPLTKAEVEAKAITGNTDFYADFRVTPKYTVNFEDVEGVLGETSYVLKDETVKDVPRARDKAPDLMNTYEFAYWTIKGDETNTQYSKEAVLAYNITENTVFVANYNTIPKLQVKFFNGEDQVGNTAYVVANEGKVNAPENPTKATADGVKYDFAGWRIDNSGIAYSAEFIETMTFAESTNFYAAYNESYLVDFINYDGAVLSENFIAPFGKYTDIPEASRARDEKIEYVFNKWVSGEDEYTSEEIAAMPITKPMTFRASYTNIYYYDATFVNGDEEIAKELVKENTSVTSTPAETPEKEETETELYEFDGWVVRGDDTNTVLTNEEVLEYPIEEDTVFEAHFNTIKKVNVRFVNFDGTQIGTTQVFAPNGNAVAPANPERASTPEFEYSFIGWRVNGEGEVLSAEQVNELVIAEDTEFVAAYEESEVLGEEFDNPDGDGEGDDEGVLGEEFTQTGDIAPITVLFVLLAMSSMAIGVVVLKKRENEN